MKPQLHCVTLGVDDVEAERKFYVDGLGWRPALDIPGDIFFVQVGHGLLLSFFGKDALEADVGPGQAKAGSVGAAFTLSHNVGSEAEVESVLEAARKAGATVLKPAQRAEFGGFHAYYADPAGFRWEICFNPGWSVGEDGTVRIEPVRP